MRVVKDRSDKYIISEVPALDPIALYLEDLGPGNGKVTITCYGKAWTAYWGAMGGDSILAFLNDADRWYLAKNLTDIQRDILDYDSISERMGTEITHENLLVHETDVVESYGRDWYHNLPLMQNPDYEYLLRIIDAVKAALVEIMEDRDGNK